MYWKYRQSAVVLLALLIAVGSSLVAWPAGKAYADEPFLDLEFDSPGTIRWVSGNITPGDSGLEPVTLRNTGNATGYLCTWVSDLIDDEGANPESETGNTTDPGELSSYLLLDIINDGMTFARLKDVGHLIVELPISLRNFPADINHALCITNTPIEVDQTLEVQWQWIFSPGAGNDAQGDTVTFTINYSLISEIPANPPDTRGEPGGGGGGGGGDEDSAPQTEEPVYTNITSPEPPPETETPVEPTIIAEPPLEARIYVSEDGRCFMYVPGDARVVAGSDQELLDVIIDIPDVYPSIPGSFFSISPVYSFYSETANGITEGMKLTRDVWLKVYFNPDIVPEYAEVAIYGYYPDSGWTRLNCVGDPRHGWLGAWTDDLYMVTVLVLPEEITEAQVVPASPTLAAGPDTEVTSSFRSIFRQISLGVAVSGVIAMTVLAYIQRRRRTHQAEDKVQNGINPGNQS